MLLFLDGQAHYDTARIGHKYSAKSDAACTWAVTAEGRFGKCIKRVSTSNVNESGYLSIAPLTTRSGSWTPVLGNGGVCGFALKVDNLLGVNGSTGDSKIFSVHEGDAEHLYVLLNPSGTFTLYTGMLSTSTLVANSSEGITSGTWMFVEFKWRIDPGAGSFEIRVNGISVLTYSGTTIEDYAAIPSLGMWNSVRIFGTQSAVSPLLTMRMCDLYLADLASADGDDVSDFLGDGVVETIMPNAGGASSGWTPSSGSNYAAVDEIPPDDDSSYVATTDPNTIDTYNCQNVPTTAVVKGLQVCLLARKEEEGAASVAPVIRQSGTNYVGPTQGVASVSYDRYITQAYDLNPATLAKFTATEVNADEFGVKKVL